MKQGFQLSKYFQEQRQLQGLSQKDVADTLGYTSPQFISNWERGISMPPISAITQLSKLYKVDSEEVFKLILDATLNQTRESLNRQFYGKKVK